MKNFIQRRSMLAIVFNPPWLRRWPLMSIAEIMRTCIIASEIMFCWHIMHARNDIDDMYLCKNVHVFHSLKKFEVKIAYLTSSFMQRAHALPFFVFVTR